MFRGIRVLLDAKNAIQRLPGAFLMILARSPEFASTKGRMIWEIWIIEIFKIFFKKVLTFGFGYGILYLQAGDTR